MRDKNSCGVFERHAFYRHDVQCAYPSQLLPIHKLPARHRLKPHNDQEEAILDLFLIPGRFRNRHQGQHTNQHLNHRTLLGLYIPVRFSVKRYVFYLLATPYFGEASRSSMSSSKYSLFFAREFHYWDNFTQIFLKLSQRFKHFIVTRSRTLQLKP